MRIAPLLALPLLIAIWAVPLQAQPAAEDLTIPPTFELTVAPAAEPRPALKYLSLIHI